MLRFHLYLELKACLGRRMQKDDADARMGAPTLEIYFLEMPRRVRSEPQSESWAAK
jgi:hypothetical protein